MVDGCFRHVCPEHASWPRNNADYWCSMLLANVARDRETDCLLEVLGWIVVRMWRHERIEAAVEKVLTAIDRALADQRMAV